MILSVVRMMEDGIPRGLVVCRDVDFETAMTITQVLESHTAQIYEELRGRGVSVGAGRPDRVRSGRVQARKILVPVAVALAALLFIFAKQLIGLFGVDGQALEWGVQHLRFIAPFFVFFALYMSNAGVLTGSGDVKAASGITLGVLAVRVALTYIFCYLFHMGFKALYWPNPFGWVFGLIISFFRFRSGKWESKRVAGK